MTHRLHRPVFILTPPRAGSTLLFKVLADAPDAWTIGGESHRVIEDIPALDPRRRGFDSVTLSNPSLVLSLTPSWEAGVTRACTGVGSIFFRTFTDGGPQK